MYMTYMLILTVNGRYLVLSQQTWHKELRDVSVGMYNLLKSHKAQLMSASSLINRLQLVMNF